jgi:hypothetical protein
MVLGVPIALIMVYALFRVVEYFMLKLQQAWMAEGPAFRTGLRLAFILVLLPARVFGWGFLIYFAFRVGIVPAIALLSIAFPSSLLLQVAPVFVLRVSPQQVITIVGILGFVLLPIMAIAMIALVPSR